MRRSLLCLYLLLLTACDEAAETSRCATSRECAQGEWCYLGACEATHSGNNIRDDEDPDENKRPQARIEIRVEDAEDVDGELGAPGPEYGVGMREEEPAATNTASGCGAPVAGELLINEVLARVPDGEAGDASGDGARDAYGDEFVEVWNVGGRAVQLDGVVVLNGERAKHTFGARCLGPLEAVVVFGGAYGAQIEAAGVYVERSQVRLGLSNSAGAVGLRGADGALLTRFVYGEQEAMSYVVWPERVGQVLVPHEQAAPGVLFSPGRCVDGRLLTTGCGDP